MCQPLCVKAMAKRIAPRSVTMRENFAGAAAFCLYPRIALRITRSYTGAGNDPITLAMREPSM